jgi:hypothetical protein
VTTARSPGDVDGPLDEAVDRAVIPCPADDTIHYIRSKDLEDESADGEPRTVARVDIALSFPGSIVEETESPPATCRRIERLICWQSNPTLHSNTELRNVVNRLTDSMRIATGKPNSIWVGHLRGSSGFTDRRTGQQAARARSKRREPSRFSNTPSDSLAREAYRPLDSCVQ